MLRRTAALLAVLVLAACGEPGAGGTPDGGAPDAGPPTTPELQAGQWTELSPGGDTGCARGGPFSFFVYPGKVNKVVIDFVGGGACWDAFTCNLNTGRPAPNDRLYTYELSQARDMLAAARGLYDKTRADNPVGDWFHVVVPYCTADVHWGDNLATYGSTSLQHKGAVNARAVLDWVYRSFSRPQSILVTGCSAGAYGAVVWAPHLQQHYAGVPVYELGDSGAGVVPSDFFSKAFPTWNALPAVPTFIPELDPAQVDWNTLSLADMYTRVGRHFPGMRLSEFNREYDTVQVGFYTLMGGSGGAQGWSTGLRSSLSQIREGAENFSSFLAPGTEHCVLPYDSFYTQESGGVRLVDYVHALVNAQPLPEVRCTGCDGGS